MKLHLMNRLQQSQIKGEINHINVKILVPGELARMSPDWKNKLIDQREVLQTRLRALQNE